MPNASIPAENATVTTTHIIPVGTPTANLADAFGPGYQVVANATLTAMPDTFKIQPLFDPKKPQTLDRVLVEWRWQITPMESGNQILDIDIEVTWLPLSQSSHLPQEGPTSLGDQQINIDVNLLASITPTPTLDPTAMPSPTLVPSPTLSPTPNQANNDNNGSQSNTTTILVAILVLVGTIVTTVGTIIVAKISNAKNKAKPKD